ncbi:DUF262 domain-containing protein [Baekduia sp. Peel2402]|uniref:DUF262 domain-containing protein n=1 Tax=Baekduia sp. Peel2402 TaxID=3458296 RepID=UPI00403E8059
MAATQPEISVRPEVLLLEDVLNEIASGRLRVPRFQRPFVWRPEQMLELFDSIERGYPIGSLLVWDTDAELESLDSVADIRLPPIPDGRNVSYILDGHQRLSTLFGSLWRRESPPTDKQRDWMWWVYRDLTRGEAEGGNNYRHVRSAAPAPATWLPMRHVLRTMDFLTYARRLQDDADPALLTQYIDDAEQIAQHLKSYKVAVVRLVGGTLDQAVDVFSRLNSSGTSMTPDLMVSALTYTQGESLADQLEAIQDDLALQGFTGVDSINIFRALLAVMGEDDILRTSWEQLARRVQGQLQPAIEESGRALYLAVEFLKNDVGVRQYRLLPYAIQLVLLAAFFSLDPDPEDARRSELRRWFWVTSWSGFFAGANTTQVKASLMEMRDFAKAEISAIPIDERARPFPDRFDMRSARVRTLLIWLFQEFPEPHDLEGNPLDPFEILSEADTGAFRHVVASSNPAGSSPANRLMFPTPRGVSVKRALIDLNPFAEASILESQCIPAAALEALRMGRDNDFVELRAEAMAKRERVFMGELGIVPSVELVGDADIDTN